MLERITFGIGVRITSAQGAAFSTRGHAAAWDEVVVRGEVSERRFVALYLEHSRVAAAFGIISGRDVRRAMKLIEARRHVDLRQLA